jgi:tripartite-type tricarboxylate transporter receptor subunit TctC
MTAMTAMAKLIACAALFLAASAQAQDDYPNKPIRLITPAAQGGTTDILARVFGAKLSEVFKQQVLVDNRASASGVVAGDMVAKAAPDGYTLLLAYHQHTVNAALNSKLPYHPVNSFTPITQLTAAAQLLVVNSASPPKTLEEFIAWTRNHPGPLNYGSAGIGSGGHMAGELYKQMTGVKAEHVPYKGTGPAMVALLANEYHFNFAGLQSGLVQVRAGRIRALAVTSPKRVPTLPELPAMTEALPGFEIVGWYGVIGPAGMPQPLVARLNSELVKAMNLPDVRERIVGDGSEPVGSTPEAFRQFMLADLSKWAKVVKESGAKLD